MTADEIATIARWHDAAYEAMRAEAGDGQQFEYLGLTLSVPPQVQPITAMSYLLGEAVLAEVRAGDHVLDMGTGCGVNALLAARTAQRVVAVDNSPVAVDAARLNAEANGLAEQLQVRHSDLFAAVPESFDLIVFDPPFRWFAARDLLEQAITDPGYRSLATFFDQVGDHLSPGGRLLMFFGSSGDLSYFRALAVRAGLQSDVVARKELHREGQVVEYLTFLMRPTV